MADAEKLQEIEEDITIRPNYFAGQYLLEDDFKSEQNYHIDRQRSHNRLLHVSGIAKGLKVSKENNLTVKVSGGTAFDSRGRQIILLEDKSVGLVKEANNNKPIKEGDYILSIRYSEELTEQQGDEKFTTTRVQEKPEFVLSSSQKRDTDTILLAELHIQGNEVTNIATINREYSGINLPNDDGKGVTLRVKSEPQNQAILEGSLRITKDLYVDGTCSIHGTGTTYISGSVHIVKSLGIGLGNPVIYVNQIVNSISDELKTDKADEKALLTVKAAVDYADTKAKKNGDLTVDFQASHLTVKELTINNKANISGSVHIGTELGIGTATTPLYVNQIVNRISDVSQKDKADEKALLTVKAVVEYADTKAKRNGDRNENFNAAKITVEKLQIANKEVSLIKNEVEGEDDDAIPTIGAVVKYVKEEMKKVRQTGKRKVELKNYWKMEKGVTRAYLGVDDGYNGEDKVSLNESEQDSKQIWVIMDVGEYREGEEKDIEHQKNQGDRKEDKKKKDDWNGDIHDWDGDIPKQHDWRDDIIMS